MISVIIPVYKVEKYIWRCVDSVLMQSHKDLEVILVDDGSPDSCGEICDQISKEDQRVRVIHKKNGGLSSARNVALDVAQGQYITFVDGDDMIHPKMLEWMVEEMKKSDADIVSTGLYSFDDEASLDLSGEKMQFELLDQKDYIDHLYPTNFGKISVTACGKLYKKEIFEELRYPEGEIYEDLKVYLDVLLRSNKISVANQALYFWYNNSQSITRSNYLRHDRFGEFAVREQYINFFHEKGLEEQALLAVNDYLTFFMRNYFAVVLRYQEKKLLLNPHTQIFISHLPQIQNNPYVCRMRKVCSRLMIKMPRMAYILARRTIPDCLIEEMR